MQEPRKTGAALALVLSASGWAAAPVVIRLLSAAYDPYTMVFMRYLPCSLVLGTVCLLWFRQESLVLLRKPWGVVGVAVINVVTQYTWTFGCYHANSTVAHLIMKMSIVFVIILSFVLFHEERGVIRSPAYLTGTLLSLVGVAMVLADEPASLVPALDRTSLILLATAVLWAVYVISGKHAVTNIHPVPMFALVAALSTIPFGVVAIFLGDKGAIVSAGAGMTTLAALSGVICIGACHSAYHFAQKHLGSALCSSLILLNPLLTYAFARVFLPQDRLLPQQFLGAAVLITGTLLVTFAGAHAHRRKRAALAEGA